MSRRLLGCVLAAGVVALVGSPFSRAQTAWAALDSVITRAGTAGTFSGVVVVAEPDADGARLLYTRTAGLADRAWGVPMDVETRFPVASVTKQVAAVVAMQLVAEGRLALDAPVERYVPGLVDARVRVVDLLRHTSGLPDPDDRAQEAFGCDVTRDPSAPDSLLDARAFVRAFASGPLLAPPGTTTRYNNADYLALQAVLEAVTGQPFAGLVGERISGPLGLEATSVATDAVEPRLAVGYAAGPDGQPVAGPCLRPARYGAAGALVMSAPDVARVGVALATGRLLPAALRDTLWASSPATGWAAMGQWAYPRAMADGQTLRLVERQGALGAYQALHVIAPERQRVVVVLMNGGTGSLFGLAWQPGLAAEIVEVALAGATERP